MLTSCCCCCSNWQPICSEWWERKGGRKGVRGRGGNWCRCKSFACCRHRSKFNDCCCCSFVFMFALLSALRSLYLSLCLCLLISLFPNLSSSLSLPVLLLCALQKRFYLFTAVFMYRELRIRKCKATQNMWALACIHMLVCTQGTCTYHIYIYISVSVSVSPLYLTRVVRWRNAHENSRSSRHTAFLELRICHLRAVYSYHTHSYTRTPISS